jgi:hypothetical protein
MKKNQDKVEFWLAKQIKRFVLASLTDSINEYYKMGYHESKDDDKKDIFNKAKITLDYIKGKEDVNTDNMSNLEGFIEYSTVAPMSNISDIFDYFLSPMRNQHQAINLVSSTYGIKLKKCK